MVVLSQDEKEPVCLNTVNISPLAPLNRVHAVTYSLAILGLLYHRCLSLLRSPDAFSLFLLLSLTLAELLLAFMWAFSQAFRWRPVRRREFPDALERTAPRDAWPGLDVFVCTADPFKEPPLSVANTVLSTMAFDYPTDRLSVYVSDDGGSPLTLFAFMEAARFSQHWLPFCREQGLVERCPEAYFKSHGANETIKSLYQEMKEKVEKTTELGRVDPDYIMSDEQEKIFSRWDAGFSRPEHPPIIQVLLDSAKDRDISGAPTPNLIYVSRGKSRASPHHFKAGALNALIRVSGALTKGDMILTLDCDMFSNDPKAPQRALCYLLDPKLSPKLAFVQFPQRFRGINEHDIYGGEHKYLYQLHPLGMDGFRGPYYLGSACFFSRACLMENSSPPSPPVSHFRCSIESDTLEEAHRLAECNYEEGTTWGTAGLGFLQTGIRYGSLSEDHNSGYHMMCRGWMSVFCDPDPAAFLGDVPITLNDALSQNTRWSLGLLQVAFSRYSPLVYGRAPTAMAMCYARYAFWPIWCVPVSIYAVLPQLALFYRVPLFPKVGEAWFFLYLYLFLAAYAQDMFEFLLGRGTLRSWWNDQRMWMTRAVTSNLFGCIQFSMQMLGFSGGGFNVTSKVMDDEQAERYERGVFDFGAESPFFVTIGAISAINLVALVVGLGRSVIAGSLGEMLLQVLVSSFVVINCWPVYEASVLRTDKGRMPLKVIRSSAFLAGAVLCVAYLALSVSSP